MRSRLFHAIVVVGTSITAGGPIAVAVSGCDFWQGRTNNPDESFWAHVDIAHAPPWDLSIVDESAWAHVDIPMQPPVDMTTDDANPDAGADLPLSEDGAVDSGSDGEG